jgi:hypothetical protein
MPYYSDVLRVYHKPKPRTSYVLINGKLASSYVTRQWFEKMLAAKQGLPFIVETPLFIYDYNQEGVLSH